MKHGYDGDEVNNGGRHGDAEDYNDGGKLMGIDETMM